MTEAPPIRSRRGAEAVRHIGIDAQADAVAIIAACRVIAAGSMALPVIRFAIDERASRARPAARGRYLLGTVTLFPAAFADPMTLAWTVLHELAHAAGQDEAEADAFARGVLSPGPRCSPSH